MTTITILQKRIVKALETGKDPAPLQQELCEPTHKPPTHDSTWGIKQNAKLLPLDHALHEAKECDDRALYLNWLF